MLIVFFLRNSPSEGSVLCEATMRMMKQNETAKAYPWTPRVHITVSIL